jgi:hypothetical protein
MRLLDICAFEGRGYLIVVNNNVIHLHMPIRISPDAPGVCPGLDAVMRH